jgi:hypothetical protein
VQTENPYASPMERCGEADWQRRFIVASLYFSSLVVYFSVFVFVFALFCGDWWGACLVEIGVLGACVVAGHVSGELAKYDEAREVSQ